MDRARLSASSVNSASYPWQGALGVLFRIPLVLVESNRDRMPELVPICYGRMLRSPFILDGPTASQTTGCRPSLVRHGTSQNARFTPVFPRFAAAPISDSAAIQSSTS